MNVLILCGSRNPEGQTARAVGAIIEGLTSAGAQHELVYLPTKNLERCRQCDDRGWGTCLTHGRCCNEDDFAGIVAKLRAADAIVFATPVYFGDLSESLRAFLDRLRRISWQELGKEGIWGKPAIGLCVAGGGGGGAPTCCVQLEKILQNCHFDVIDVMPARRQNLAMKVGLLKEVGRSLASSLPAGSTR